MSSALNVVQIESNRRNAQQSTGPRTEAGKKTSSLNALRHGLTAIHNLNKMQGLPDSPTSDAAPAGFVWRPKKSRLKIVVNAASWKPKSPRIAITTWKDSTGNSPTSTTSPPWQAFSSASPH
jgi:hypothetical protein